VKYTTYLVHFPDGGTQEVDYPVPVGPPLDVNARPLPLPLSSPRVLAYRVSRRTQEELRSEIVVHITLEQLFPDELGEYL
jgi:hypothetical protein